MKTRSTTIIKVLGFAAFVAVVCVIAWQRSRGVGGDREGLGKSFDFDLQQHMKVDPALLIYREADPIAVDRQEVTALATGPADRIYVGGDRSILLFDAGGEALKTIPLADTPQCIAVDADGTVFVGIGNQIAVYDAAGKRTARWEGPASDTIIASIVIRGEDVFAGDARQGQVLRFDRAGRIVSEFKGLVMFSSFNLALAIDPQNRLWAANPGAREVRRYEDDGTVAAFWKKPSRDITGFSGCCNPTDIAIRADGAVVTSEKNIVRVKVVSQTGALIGVVAGPQSFDPKIEFLDVAVDARGRVLVLDPVKKAVRIFVEKAR